MNKSNIRTVSLSPEALDALEADGEIKFDKPMSDKAIRVIRRSMARKVFGPTMMPTLKPQLLTFVSFAAIKASWAADWWQLKMKEKYG